MGYSNAVLVPVTLRLCCDLRTGHAGHHLPGVAANALSFMMVARASRNPTLESPPAAHPGRFAWAVSYRSSALSAT
ncbi:hypothetical protein DSL92_05510 [Billgrantia gudaonensis]|uniref:Uncharacterized protein n=1 Tax=Billgrantia gudaonensis TaxID=376427 RepID=A0A3S0NHC8_9GAMM|nr:hypothetical protein DSL92_05510 [Halomonas gudaonensis]